MAATRVIASREPFIQHPVAHTPYRMTSQEARE
jgi:hypothetical protein